jgi:DNA-binding response OmpR family regulator
VSRILVVDDDQMMRKLLRSVLTKAGFAATVAKDGIDALKVLRTRRFDLMLLDVWMPRMNGLELLAKLRTRKSSLRVIVMTSDDAPGTLLNAVRQRAFKYLHKPIDAQMLLQEVRETLESAPPPPIEVISGRPEWVELEAPCTREAAEHIHTVMSRLDTGLEEEVRESIAYAFRELLLNAVEWGGRLDPKRKVRIACVRTDRMLFYRIADPGSGFQIENLPHAAIGQAPDDPIAHVNVREAKGMRPGGFGLLTVRSSVDELVYNEKRNEVVFVKYLTPARRH